MRAAGVLLLLAIVTGLLLSCGGGKKPSTTPTGPGVASATVATSEPVAPTASAPPGSPLAEFHGVPFYELKPTAAAALPAAGVLYFTETCATCEGGALFRAQQAVDGSWTREPLLATAPPGVVEGAAIGPFASDGGAQFAVLWCHSAFGPCRTPHGGAPNSDPRSLLYSWDGAVTWQEMAAVPSGSFILGFRDHEVVVGFPDGTYALHPAAESVPQPLTSSFITADVPPGWQSVETGDAEFGLRLANQASSVVGVFPTGGGPSSYFTFPGGNLELTGWLSSSLLMGAAERGAKAMLTGSSEVLGSFDRLPVLIDLDARTVAPIKGLVPSSPYAWLRPMVFRHGSFLRVASVDSCLHVREKPAKSSLSLGCFHDGVLLRLRTEPERTADGATWVAVVTPTGEPGWAAAGYLER